MSEMAVPRTVLGPDQLFSADITAQYGSTVYALEAQNKTWVAIDEGFDTVGGRRPVVQRVRTSLAKVFPATRSGIAIGESPVSDQLGGEEFERALSLARQLEGAEAGLNDLPGSFEVVDLEERGIGLRRALTIKRNREYADRIADINEGIDADPSDILFGIAVRGVPMAAKLERVYSGLRAGKKTILPVLSGQNGEPCKSPRAEDVKVYGIFAEAFPTGAKQAMLRASEEQEDYDRVRDEFVRSGDVPTGMIS